MSYSAAAVGFRAAQTHSIDTMNSGPFIANTNTASALAYPSANLAIYVPVRVRYAGIIKKLWVASSTTATGNFDLGVYDSAGTLKVSAGSTAKVGATDEQVVDVTDTAIGPGLYYLALCCSNNTDTFLADNSAAPNHSAMGLLTQANGAVTLQATATWAILNTLAYYPEMGMLLEPTMV